MSRPRTPLAKARLIGADRKNPQRYRGRSEPAADRPLGPPPVYLSATAKKAWRLLSDELPWLTFADRGILEATACQRAAVMVGGAGLTMAFLRAYKQALSSLGATPVDRHKVANRSDDDGDDRFAFLDVVRHHNL